MISGCRMWSAPMSCVKEAERPGSTGILVCSVATKVEQVRSINEFIRKNVKNILEFLGLAPGIRISRISMGEFDDIQEKGLSGIKLHPDFQKFHIDDDRMIAVYREANRRGLPVLFHTGDSRTDFSSPRRLMNVVEKIPDFTCIAAIWADIPSGKLPVGDLKGTNVYIDTSVPFLWLRGNRLWRISHILEWNAR